VKAGDKLGDHTLVHCLAEGGKQWCRQQLMATGTRSPGRCSSEAAANVSLAFALRSRCCSSLVREQGFFQSWTLASRTGPGSPIRRGWRCRRLGHLPGSGRPTP
jgi:hypothetical protein